MEARVLLPLGEGRPGRSASPKGRSLNKGPDEGPFPALTRRFAPPSPKGRGTSPKQVSKIENPMKPASVLLLERTASRNLDKSLGRTGGHRPPLQSEHFLPLGKAR